MAAIETHPPSGPSTPPPPPGPKEYARRLVAAWPPLTPEQRLTIATLLRPDLPVGICRENSRRAA